MELCIGWRRGVVQGEFVVLCTAFRRGKEGSRKLTSQLVAVARERLELGQIADALRQLCRNELFSREILRTGFRWGKDGSKYSPVSWFE